MQRNADALAVMLWKRAYPDVDHEAIIKEVYEEKLNRHLRYVPHLDERETLFDPEYTYNRSETCLALASEPMEDSMQGSVIERL